MLDITGKLIFRAFYAAVVRSAAKETIDATKFSRMGDKRSEQYLFPLKLKGWEHPTAGGA